MFIRCHIHVILLEIKEICTIQVGIEIGIVKDCVKEVEIMIYVMNLGIEKENYMNGNVIGRENWKETGCCNLLFYKYCNNKKKNKLNFYLLL